MLYYTSSSGFRRSCRNKTRQAMFRLWGTSQKTLQDIWWTDLAIVNLDMAICLKNTLSRLSRQLLPVEIVKSMKQFLDQSRWTFKSARSRINIIMDIRNVLTILRIIRP